jgi:hypothetical protein
LIYVLRNNRLNVMENKRPGRTPKGGHGVETTSITIRIPKPFKETLIERAEKSGLSDLSSYVIAVLKEYSVSLELKKVE